MSRSAKKYVPNLASLQATSERNYQALLQLLPDCDSESLCYEFAVHGGLTYRIEILESSRYTSTLSIAQIHTSVPAYLQPKMVVRLYHDARMAEVISSQHAIALAPSYDYPNKNMRQRNEKHMVNVFLAEWLHFCLNQQRQPLMPV